MTCGDAGIFRPCSSQVYQVTPSGHEQYLEGVAELLSRPGPPDQSAIIDLRARYDIEQLTPMIPDRRRDAGPA